MVPYLPPLSPARATEIIRRFADCSLCVVGDVMLDRFLVGRVTRISPEAPVPVVSFDHEEFRLGGAANVAHNIRALGAGVTLVGLVGTDDEAALLEAELQARNIPTSGLVADPARRTTTKMRVVTSRNQQVARIDYESDAELAAESTAALAAVLRDRSSGAQALVVSDYSKGVVSAQVMGQAVASARARAIPLVVDPKVPDLRHYLGATLVTPNHVEAERATGMKIRTAGDAQKAAHALRLLIGCEGVLVTLGELGMWLSHVDAEGSLPAAAREVADVTGAGDTVLATLAVSIAAGATAAEAARLANEAAGIVVGKFGAATVGIDELRRALKVD